MITWADGATNVPLAGFKVYYTDGTLARVPAETPGSLASGWALSPDQNVVGIIAFFNRTYGVSVDGVNQTRNYLEVLHSGNHFYLNAFHPVSEQSYGMVDSTGDIPVSAAAKRNSPLPDAQFYPIYNAMLADQVF